MIKRKINEVTMLSLFSFCLVLQVFPSHFTQQRCKDLLASSSDLDSRLSSGSSVGGSVGLGSRSGSQSQSNPNASNTQSPLGSSAATPQSLGISTDFWDLLVKLDNMNVSRKGKASMKMVPLGAGADAEGAQFSLETSPLGQLMNMLSHPVIRRSSLLTEKLLRLLSLISIALPDNKATEVPAGHPTPQAANPSTASSGATASATTQGTASVGSVQTTVPIPGALVGAAAQSTSSGSNLSISQASSTTIIIPTSTGITSTGTVKPVMYLHCLGLFLFCNYFL